MNYKKIIIGALAVLGAIFIACILLGVYVYYTDPWNLWSATPVIEETSNTVITETNEEEQIGETADTKIETQSPTLTEGQQNALEFVGIDPTTLPTTITAEQKACFDARLGSDRVAEITAGDTPTVIEVFVAKDCLN